jgi:hypothetical protein
VILANDASRRPALRNVTENALIRHGNSP